MQDAVRMEDFSRAAQLKRELEQLEAADVVAQVQRDLAAALKEERYEDAARLRDAGMAALQVSQLSVITRRERCYFIQRRSKVDQSISCITCVGSTRHCFCS
jgi:hypothetical protein